MTKLLCRLFDHKLEVNPGPVYRVSCRRCSEPGPEQKCPYCPRPIVMMPAIDRQVHRDCFAQQALEQLFPFAG